MKEKDITEDMKKGEELGSYVARFAEKHDIHGYTDGFDVYLADFVSEKLYSDKLMFSPLHMLETMKMIVKLREREVYVE